MTLDLPKLHHKPSPLPIRLYNGILGNLKYPSIKFGSLLKAAQKKTGLSDFGDQAFVEPLRKLLEAIESEAQLHAFGRFVTHTRLLNLLCNRLRAEYWFTRHPEILEADLLPIVMVTGLQRTGTTMLQRLLAADPNSRALLSWEALYPAPMVNAKQSKPDPRISMAKTSEKGLRYIAPEFFAIHPVEHDAPEEEVLLLDTTFLSTAAEAILHVPTFKDWLENQDQRPGYDYMIKLMKLLQWQRPGKWWVLKSPHHLEYLDVLLEAAIGTRIVQTHRDPVETIPSFCNMIYHSRRIFSNKVSPASIADQWTAKIERALTRSMEVRESAPPGTFIDLSYRRLTTDPVAQLRELYSQLNFPVDDELVQTWNRTLDQNRQHKYGVHRYDLESFGLTQVRIQDSLSDYYHKFRDYI